MHKVNNIKRKIMLLMACLTLWGTFKAQSYLIEEPVFSINLDTSDFGFTRGIEVLNTGTINLNFTWELLLEDTLIDSEFDLCNSGECFNDLPQGGVMPPILPGEIGWLKLHMFTGKATGLNTIKYLLKGNNTKDTLTFLIYVGQPNSIFERSIENGSLNVFPNPAKEFTQLNFNANKAIDLDLSIYDIAGKLVYTENKLHMSPGNNGIKVNTSDFASGTYKIVLSNKNTFISNQLMIVK